MTVAPFLAHVRAKPAPKPLAPPEICQPSNDCVVLRGNMPVMRIVLSLTQVASYGTEGSSGGDCRIAAGCGSYDAMLYGGYNVVQKDS